MTKMLVAQALTEANMAGRRTYGGSALYNSEGQWEASAQRKAHHGEVCFVVYSTRDYDSICGESNQAHTHTLISRSPRPLPPPPSPLPLAHAPAAAHCPRASLTVGAS